MSRPDGPLLVLGIGNVLLRDDGIGVRVVRTLEGLAARGEVRLPPGVRLLDGGTLGLGLLGELADARAIVVIDAVDLSRPPGSIEVLRGDAIGVLPGEPGASRADAVGELLAAARLLEVLPETIALVGIQPAEIAAGLGLTAALEAALPAAVETALTEIHALHAITPRSGCGSIARDHDLAPAGAGGAP